MKQQQIIGSLLGTALGDAIGLPYEGLSRRRGARMLGKPDRHRLLFGRGMISDDTEHACMTAQALLASGGEVDLFRTQLARRLRYWLLAMPAGVGFATARSVLRLWIGFDPRGSGVFSAGNGAAMRAPIIGAAFDDLDKVCELVRASTRITHGDKKAEFGALAAALATHMACRQEFVAAADFLANIKMLLDDDGEEFLALIGSVVNSVNQKQNTQAFAASIGLENGVSGYTYHTIPVAIHAWLTNQHDFRAAIISIVECGGDTDSTAAIVGGIIGAAVGKEGLPADWLRGLFDWPRSISWMEQLGFALGSNQEINSQKVSVELPLLATFPRNLFFLGVVLFHGFRRLLPPY
jgi:ADP-ribosyl-[dinitrogen reductase] hydrolase